MTRGRGSLLVAAALVIPALALPATERAYAPEAVPRIAAFPKLIGVGSNGAIEVQVEMPPRGGKPRLTTFEGSVGEATNEEGLWYARYKPPATLRGPGFDVIVARSETGAAGIGIIELHAPAKVVIDGQPPATSVTVKVTGRDFGPFITDANGEANLSMDIPPGVDEVQVVAPGKEPAVVKLAVPPLRRMFLSAPPMAAIGKSVEIMAVAIDRKGGVLQGTPSIVPTNAAIKSLTEIGPGVWRITVIPEGGPLTVTVRNGKAKGKVTIVAPWPKKTPVPMPTLDPAPTPDLVAEGSPPAVIAANRAPTCDELKIAPGAVVTAARLKARIDEASRQSDLIARRDRLLELECVFPEEHAVRLQLTAAWLLLGENQSALAQIDPLLKDEEEIHDEHRALGLSYQASAQLRLGQLDASVASSRGALTLLPGLYSASYTLGEALFLKKDFSGAQAALMSAYRAAPGFASDIDHSMLAEILEARRQYGEAVPHRMALAKYEPNDLDRWRDVARAAEAAGTWARSHEAWMLIAASTLPGFAANGEALAGAARAAVAAPGDPEIARIETAIASERANNAEKAIFLLEKAVNEHQHNLAARYHYARLLSSRGEVVAASMQVKPLLGAAPRWVPALVLAGDIDRNTGDTEKALARYREAANVVPPAPMSTVAKWRLTELSKAQPPKP